MATTDLPSRDSKVHVSTDDVTYQLVGSTKDNLDFELSGEKIDTTDRDSGLFKTNQPGRGELKMSFGGNYDEADAGQALIKAAAFNRTALYFRFRPATGGGNRQFKAIATVTSFKVAAPNDGIVGFSVSADLSGAPSDTAQ